MNEGKFKNERWEIEDGRKKQKERRKKGRWRKGKKSEKEGAK